MSFIEDFTKHIDGVSSCHGKVKYGHEASAKTAANKMTLKKMETLESYKCRHCPAWHVGHPRFSRWTEEQKRILDNWE